MQSTQLENALKAKYSEIIAEYAPFLNEILMDNNWAKLHLGSVPAGYAEAKNKILIIGRETKGWCDKKNFKQYDEQVISELMLLHKNVFEKCTDKKKMDQGNSFFNFVRKVADRSGLDGILWGNIFSLSYKLTNPASQQKYFEQVKALSGELLKAQIEILKPQIVIFANGFSHASIEARKEYFPDMKYAKESPIKGKGLPKKCLEEFFMPKEFGVEKCYRVSHPSALAKKYQDGIENLITLLPEK